LVETQTEGPVCCVGHYSGWLVETRHSVADWWKPVITVAGWWKPRLTVPSVLQSQLSAAHRCRLPTPHSPQL